MRKILSVLAMCICALGTYAAAYNGVYMTANGVYSQQDSTVTITITRADVLDGASHIIETEQMIGFEIMRGEGHGTKSKIGTIAPVKFIGSMPEHPIVFVDRNLPNPGTSGSMLMSYGVVAVIGEYHSQENEVGSYNIDYQNYPNPVSNLQATIAEDQRSVTLSFTAPTHYTNGKPLTSINNIKVEKYNMSTYTWKAVKTFRSTTAKPGTELSWTDTAIVRDQQMGYRVQVWTVGGKVTIENGTGTGTQEVDRNMHSDFAEVYVYIGEDAPTEMKELRAEMRDSAVYLSWTPSNRGLYGGQLDIKSLRYHVQRSVEGSAFVTLAEAWDQTQFVDTALLANTASYLYLVTPYNERGTAAGSSAGVYGGTPYMLPFVETAAPGHAFDHTGWLSTTVKGNGSGGWCAATYMMDTKNEKYVYASDNSGLITNLLYATSTAVGRYDYLLSAPIYSQGHQSYQLSIDYYGMAGFDNILALELCDHQDHFSEVGRISFDTIKADGWRTATWTVDSFATEHILRVRVISIKGKNSNSLAIDNLRLAPLDEAREEPTDPKGDNPGDTPGDTPGDNPGNNPGDTPGDNPGDEGVEDVFVSSPMDGIYYNILGQRVSPSYHGIVIINGHKSLR